MRKTFITTILAVVLTGSAIFSGCADGGSGDVVTETKDITDFTSVSVENTFEVEITQSDSFSITTSVDESLLDYIAVAKEGETLRIYLNPRHPFTDFTLRDKTLKATITMPTLSGLYLSGAVKGTISGFKSSADFRLVVSGASSLKIDGIEVGNTNFEVSGASKVSGSINATDVKLEVSGASNIELEGAANNITLSASGTSKLNLANLPLNYANINLSGASEATIYAREKLDTVLSGASTLYFLANPAIGNISVSGASTIKHK